MVQAKQHGEGMVESTKGNVRETVGKVTGNKSQEAHGKIQGQSLRSSAQLKHLKHLPSQCACVA